MNSRMKLSPPLLLILYTLAAFVLTYFYYLVFPVRADILKPFSALHTLYTTIDSFVRFFPAVALSSLILWFSLRILEDGSGLRFSLRFMDDMRIPLLSALLASILYAILSLYLGPMAVEQGKAIETKSSLFHSSSDRSLSAFRNADYGTARSYVDVCLAIWPSNDEILARRSRIMAEIDEIERLKRHEQESPVQDSLGRIQVEGENLDVLTAMTRSREAFARRDYLSAHWYASLASLISPQGSPERRDAVRLQSESWNEISALESDMDNPKDEATRLRFARHRRKMEGYTALMAGEALRAYYIFEELVAELPSSISDDPDIKRYHQLSREALESIAFFSDEPESLLGEIHVNLLFSLPALDGSRDIIRASSLRIFSDAAYAEGWEQLRVDANDRELFSYEASRVKIVPLGRRSSGEHIEGISSAQVSGEERALAVLLVAVDRHDQSKRTDPLWHSGSAPDDIDSRIVIPLGYDQFLRLARIRSGFNQLSFTDLFQAREGLSNHGYSPGAFLLNFLIRLSEPFTFLALAILALSLGWHFRAHERPGLLILPVIAILPFVVDIGIRTIRLVQASALAAIVVSVPGSWAIVAMFTAEALFVGASVLFLAGQRA